MGKGIKKRSIGKYRLPGLVFLRGFEFRMVVPFVAMVLLIVVSMTAVSFIMERDRVAEYIEHLTRILVQNLADNSEVGVFAENAGYIQPPLDAIFSEGHVLFAALYNDSGRIIASRATISTIRKVQPDFLKMVIDKRKVITKFSRLRNGRGFIDAYAPIVLKRHPDVAAQKISVIGVARLGISTDVLDKQVREVLLGGIFVLILFSILGGAAAIVVARKVTKPVLELARGARSIGSGELSKRIDIRRSDEIGQLARDFNAMAETLEHRTLELHRKNKDMESFLYSMSHDLKAPLASIKGLIQLLERVNEGKLDEKSMHYIERIHVNCDWMQDLIAGVLKLSRLGRKRLTISDVDMMDVTRAVLDILEGGIVRKGIRVDLPATMPIVKSERNRMTQVMQNLIGNAVKFIGDDNPNPVIQIGWTHDNPGEYEFFVRDNGIGISKEHLEGLFDLFQKFGPQNIGGTGVGLAVVRRIVELHGGSVRVSSEYGQGSTFYFTLPDKEEYGTKDPDIHRG